MKIALLWHMHQPSYIKNNKLFLPWVFLHSIKDYYDMAYLCEKHSVKVTFNLTPTLLEQILMYQNIEVDEFLTILSKENPSLDEKKSIVNIIKSKENKINQNLSNQEFLDLEVKFLLSWCGNYLRENNKLIQNLLQKENFSQEEKLTLLDELIKFVKGIIPYYKKLFNESKIEISTTPFYHPITPLLIDANIAKVSNPNTVLPKGIISLKDDAILHIKKSITFFNEIFEKSPVGFWPSEGAVDEESIRLYNKFNIKWIATDEDILKKTGFSDINKVYEYNDVKLFFRNHTLSDLIGFTYRYYTPLDAVNDFKNRLDNYNIIILDGENAWEYYINNGKDFLETFYNQLKDNFVFFKKDAEIKLDNIKAGSWIYGDFNTWISDEEKNRAWELLFDTKRDFLRKPNEDAREELLKAECSDWFWWYGKGHFTEYSKEFDYLFREHLKNVYKLRNIPYPKVLDEPIVGKNNLKNILSKPKDYIFPIIDGKVSNFFEWMDAGVLYEGGDAMQANDKIKYIYWGENNKNFYIRLDGEKVSKFEYNLFFEEQQLNPKIVKKEIVEMQIEKSQFLTNEGVLRIEVLKKGKIIQILPTTTRLFIKINNNYIQNWFI